MRIYFLMLFWFVGTTCSFGQVSSLPVLYYLKENLIKIPVEVPQGKRLFWESVFYNEKGKYIGKSSNITGRYTPNPNEFLIYPPLGKIHVVASLDGKEVWKQTFFVKRSTNILYKKQENDIIAEVDLPKYTHLTFETDNGTLWPYYLQARIFPAQEGTCTVTAKHQGKIVWQNTFEVRDLPSYTLYLGNANGKALDISKPLPTNTETRVCINVDSTFRQSLRNGYFVGEIRYILSRGGTTISSGKSISDIPTPQSLGARSGDKMTIQTITVHHIIPHGHKHEIKLPPITSFTIIVK
jgi:hypothetical protein